MVKFHYKSIFLNTYNPKGVGKPQYYLGDDIGDLGLEWEKEDIFMAFSAETYITNAFPKLAKSCGLKEFQKANTSFDENYHPELNESPLLPGEQMSVYKSLIGSAIWIINLGRFDIAYAINALSRYFMASREGHMKDLERVFLDTSELHSKGNL